MPPQKISASGRQNPSYWLGEEPERNPQVDYQLGPDVEKEEVPLLERTEPLTTGWFGEASKVYGLHGQGVRHLELGRWLDGFDPRDGTTPLAQNAGKVSDGRGWRQSAHDFHADTEKDLSAILVVAPEKAPELVEGVWAAGRKFAGYLGQFAQSRQQIDGEMRVVPASVAFAATFDVFSRAGDPLIGLHFLAMGSVVRPDGSTGSLHAVEMYRNHAAARALFSAECAALAERLGFEVVRSDDGRWRNPAFDKIRDEFSTRSRDVNRIAEVRGQTSYAEKRFIAQSVDRPPKDVTKGLTLGDAIEKWQDQVRDLGHSIEKLREQAMEKGRDVEPLSSRLERARTETVDELSKRSAPVSERDVVETMAKRSPARLGADAVLYGTRQLLASGRYIAETPKGTTLYFDRKKREKARLEIPRFVEALRERNAKPVHCRALERGLRGVKDPAVSRAVLGLFREEKGFAALDAPASKERDQVLRAAKETLERSGNKVVVITATRKERDRLRRELKVPVVTAAKAALEWNRARPSWLHPKGAPFVTPRTDAIQDRIGALLGLPGMTARKARFNAWQRDRAPLDLSRSARRPLQGVAVLVSGAERCFPETLAPTLREAAERGASVFLFGDSRLRESVFSGLARDERTVRLESLERTPEREKKTPGPSLLPKRDALDLEKNR